MNVGAGSTKNSSQGGQHSIPKKTKAGGRGGGSVGHHSNSNLKPDPNLLSK